MLFTQRITRSPRGPSVRTYNFRSCDRQLPWPWSIVGGGNGTRRNAAGLIETIAAANSPRFDYDPATLTPRGLLIERGSTNYLRNNTMVGAITGSPGTIPTNWDSGNNGSGLAWSVIGTGQEGGVNYIDVLLAGAATKISESYIFFDVSTSIAPAAVGQVWTSSAYLRRVAGSNVNVTGVLLRLEQLNGAAVGVGQISGANQIGTLDAASIATNRVSSTWAVFASTTTNVRALFIVQHTAGPVDITLRIGLPQFERDVMTSPIPTSNATVIRALEQVTCTDLSLLGYKAAGFTFSVGWEHNAPGAGTTPTVLAFRDAAAQNRVQLLLDNANQLSIRVDSGGATLDQRVIAAAAANTKHRAVVAVTPAGIQVSVDGGAAVAYGVAVPLAAFTRGELGGLAGADASALNGWLRDYKDWPRVLSTNELVAEAAAV